MNNATEFDEQEKADFFAPDLPCCINCGATSGLCDIWPDDEPQCVLACDDCVAEIRRLEAIAGQLAALPSCEVRQALIDQTETTRGLVNVLTAHDQTCGCVNRKPVSVSTSSVASTGVDTKIKTTYDPKPIPDHRADWEAWIEGTEDEGMALGYGATEADAIADLHQILEEREVA